MASIFSARAITLFIIAFSSSVRSGLSLCHRSHIRGTQVKQRRVQCGDGRHLERVNNTEKFRQSRLPRMHASLLVVGPPAIRGAAHHCVRHGALWRSADWQKERQRFQHEMVERSQTNVLKRCQLVLWALHLGGNEWFLLSIIINHQIHEKIQTYVQVMPLLSPSPISCLCSTDLTATTGRSLITKGHFVQICEPGQCWPKTGNSPDTLPFIATQCYRAKWKSS